MGRVFDAFTFFNELDILELRLKEIGNVVDYIVICESPYTFKGEGKPLYFSDNKARFSEYLGKIIHLVDEDIRGLPTAWQREHHQREYLRHGLNSMSDGDVALISDVDEIPRAETISKLKELEGAALLDMPMYQFFLNMQAKNKGWNKAFAADFSILPRIKDFSEIRSKPTLLLEQFPEKSKVFEDAGWHFTFLGGAERVRQKLKAYSHAGDVVDTILETGGAENQIHTGRMIGSIDLLKTVKIDSKFPAYIIDRYEHFKKIGFIKEIEERLSELELLRGEEMQEIAGAMEKRLNEMRKEFNFAQQRRQETGKRLQFFEQAYKDLEVSMRSINSILIDRNLSDQQKIELISSALTTRT